MMLPGPVEGPLGKGTPGSCSCLPEPGKPSINVYTHCGTAGVWARRPRKRRHVLARGVVTVVTTGLALPDGRILQEKLEIWILNEIFWL